MISVSPTVTHLTHVGAVTAALLIPTLVAVAVRQERRDRGDPDEDTP